MESCKPIDTSVTKGVESSLSQCPKGDLEIQAMNGTSYASVVGSLMHAQICTRPDIVYNVGMLEKLIFK